MEIKTPRGEVIINDKTMRAEIKWNPGFENGLSRQYGANSPLQRFIDNAVLHGNDRYVPFKTGTLMRSGELGTVIGEGVVSWIAPYTRYLYYGKLMVGRESRSSWAMYGERKVLTEQPLRYGQGRGSFWFETWKSKHLPELMDGISKKFGTETEAH